MNDTNSTQQSQNIFRDQKNNSSIQNDSFFLKLIKKDFWITPKGIAIIAFLVLLFNAGVALGSYYYFKTIERERSSEAKNVKSGSLDDKRTAKKDDDMRNVTPSPSYTDYSDDSIAPSTSPTSTTTPNSTPTPTQPRNTPTPTPSATPTATPYTTQRKFSIVNYQDPSDHKYKISIKLDNQVIKVLSEPESCNIRRIDGIPMPVLNRDKTKVYYIDPYDPTKVKEIDNRGIERVYFDPKKLGETLGLVGYGYKYVAGMAMNSGNDSFGYTILKETADPCGLLEGYVPRSAFYIISRNNNPRLIEYFDSISVKNGKYEIITALGDEYFVTNVISKVNLMMDPKRMVLRTTSNAEKVRVYGSSPSVVYQYLDIIILKKGISGDFYELPSDNEVVRIDLNRGGEYCILGKTGNGRTCELDNSQGNILVVNISVSKSNLSFLITYDTYDVNEDSEYVYRGRLVKEFPLIS